MPPSGTSTGGSPPCSTRSAVGFITEAASRASTAAPKKVTPPADVESINDSVAANLVSAAASAVAQDDGCGGGVDLREIPGLKELEMRAADEDCTPAGAAQALARVACRLYEVADKIGGAVGGDQRRGRQHRCNRLDREFPRQSLFMYLEPPLLSLMRRVAGSDTSICLGRGNSGIVPGYCEGIL